MLVVCDEECGDPCELNINLNTEINGCEYTFSPIIASPCPGVTYQFAWGIQSVGTQPLSYNNSLTYEFSQSSLEIIQLTIAATKPSGKTCDKQVFQFPIDVICKTRRARIGVSPNPSKINGELLITGIDAKDLYSIEVFDLFGISKMKTIPSQNKFNIRTLRPGIYIVRFYTVNGIEQKKIIIE